MNSEWSNRDYLSTENWINLKEERTFPLPNQSHKKVFAIGLSKVINIFHCIILEWMCQWIRNIVLSIISVLLWSFCIYIVQPNVEQMWRGTIYQEVATEETNDWHHTPSNHKTQWSISPLFNAFNYIIFL
mgnify:CR=1 FL=1